MWQRIFPKLWPALNLPIRNWQGRRVWVVGASSGIGAALARELRTAGAELIVSARREVALQQVVDHQGHMLVLPFDVCDAAAWIAAYQSIINRLGGVDMLIFCAAQYHPERSWEVLPEHAQETLQVNLTSVYSGLAAVLPDMLARSSGGIALVASVAGYMGLPNASVYGPSKAAMINLAEILYGDLHSRGVSVYLINPGFVDTGLTRKNSFYMPALMTPLEAARAILDGFAQGKFEIHFPGRFTRVLKLVHLFPYRLRYFLLRKMFL